MGIRAVTYLPPPASWLGSSRSFPIYTVAVLMSFLATRFGTTIIYGQRPWRLRPLLLDVPAADRPVVSFAEALAMAAAVMAVHTYYGYTATGVLPVSAKPWAARCAPPLPQGFSFC